MTVGLSIFKDVIDTTEGKVVIYRLSKLEEWGIRNTYVCHIDKDIA